MQFVSSSVHLTGISTKYSSIQIKDGQNKYKLYPTQTNLPLAFQARGEPSASILIDLSSIIISTGSIISFYSNNHNNPSARSFSYSKGCPVPKRHEAIYICNEAGVDTNGIILRTLPSKVNLALGTPISILLNKFIFTYEAG